MLVHVIILLGKLWIKPKEFPFSVGLQRGFIMYSTGNIETDENVEILL